MKKKLVSIIIPAYNSEKYLEEAVNSALNQTYTDIEIIIIDDGSTDSTLKIAQSFKSSDKIIKVVFHEHHSNKGVSKSRQLGIDNAEGEYIAFLDADDVFEMKKIELQVECLQKNENSILSHTATSYIIDIDEEKDIDFPFNRGNTISIYNYNQQAEFLLSNFICNSSVLVRHSIIKEINIAQNQIFQYEDWLVWSLLSYKGNFAYLPEKLTKYRYHQQSATYNVSSNKLKEIYSYIEFLLNFVIRTKVEVHKQKALSLFKDTINNLYLEYANQVSETVEIETLFSYADASVTSEIDVLSLTMKKNFLENKNQVQALENHLRTIESKIEIIDKSLSIKNIPKRIVHFFTKK